MPQLISSKVSLRLATDAVTRTYAGFAPGVTEAALNAFATAVNSIQDNPLLFQKKIVENLYDRRDLIE